MKSMKIQTKKINKILLVGGVTFNSSYSMPHKQNKMPHTHTYILNN